jgi:small GTP-binding protein
MEKDEKENQEDNILMNPHEMEKDEEINENKENNNKDTNNNIKLEKEENDKEEKEKENNDDENDELEAFKNEPEEIKIERLKGDIKTYDRSLKVILIGDSKVGKTNILNRLVNNEFNAKHIPSLSLEYYNHSIKINNYIIRMQIWDTAGQEKTNSLISNYYRSAEVAIFVYSINDIKSYNSIQEWYKELINEGNEENSNVKKVLLGNKLDLENDRQVDKNIADTFAKENGFEVFAEITCKNDDQQKLYNIGNIFDAIGKLFYDEFSQSRDTVMTMSSFHYIASNSILESKRNTETESKQPEKKDGGCCICLCF